MSLQAVHTPQPVNLREFSRNKGVRYTLWPNDNVSFMQFLRKSQQNISRLSPRHISVLCLFCYIFSV